jgi:hypothetical protein
MRGALRSVALVAAHALYSVGCKVQTESPALSRPTWQPRSGVLASVTIFPARANSALR